jgi:hypothetical protein
MIAIDSGRVTTRMTAAELDEVVVLDSAVVF